MTLSSQGVCFRNTTGYVTNPSGHVWCNPLAGSYSGALGVGMVTGSSNATSTDENTAVPAIAGNFTFARPQIAQYDLPAGQYTLRLCSGRVSTAVDTNIAIWDGGLKDGATQVTNTNLTTYAASTGFSSGQYVIVGDKLYKCITTGTSGASSAPSGTAADITDGTVHWKWIKTAIFTQFRAASGSVLVDAAGNTYASYAAWDSGNAEYGSPITVGSSSFVQITRGQNTQSGVLRYVGFTPVATPLADVSLLDDEGNSLGTTPAFYEKQPAGKLIAKLSISAGALSAANFAVGGTLTSPTLGGTASTYFQIVQRPNTLELWLAATGVRLPADCTGTLTIVQTDGSAFVTGSPHTTTFNPTFISANGRQTDTSALGLISTQCYNQHYLVKSKLDAAWAGYSSQTFNGGDVAVASGAALVTQMTTFAASAASGKWFRIRCQAGTWNANITLPEVDFYKDGTGGLLIEPDTGHDPEISGMWTTTALRGVEIKGLLVTGPYAFGDSSATTKWINSSLPTGTIYNICIVRRCRMGLSFGAAPLTDSQILGTTDLNRTHFWPVNFSHGDLVRVLNCTFKGYENGINCSGVRLFESAYNDFSKMIADCHGTGPFSGAAEKKGVLTDDHCYHSYHDNTVRGPIDNWNTAGLTVATYLHADFVQVRAPYVYAGSKVTQLGAFALVGGNFYKCTQAGTTGASSPPSGTGTGIVDGSVLWDFYSTQDNGPRFYATLYNNVLNVCGTSYFDEASHRYSPGIQFLINSDNSGPAGFTIFNNISATKSSYGHFRTVVSNVLSDYVEYNSLVGPAVITDTSGGAYNNDVQTDSTVIASGSGTASKIKTYKNAIGSLGTGVFDEANLLISAQPNAATAKKYSTNFTGAFTFGGGGIAAPNGFTVYNVTYDGSNASSAFQQQMARRFTQTAAASGYGAVTATWASGFRTGGLRLGLRLGL